MLTPLSNGDKKLVSRLFVLNGAIYIADRVSILGAGGDFTALTQLLFEMSPEEGIDVDYPDDLALARFRFWQRSMPDEPKLSQT